MLTMYDDVTLSRIPKDAEAVAGYVNGRWPTYSQMVKEFPKAKHLSIAVTAFADAECLDVEPGDASNAQAPAWVKRQLKRGVHRPVVYTSASNAAALIKTLSVAGVMRSQYRLWTAHYTGKAHLCGPACGFNLKSTADATQWTDKARGESLDQSLCAGGFFDVPVPPKPKPVPPPPPKPVPVPVPPAPKPAPAPAPTVIPKGKIEVTITNKDRTVLNELATKAGFLARAAQFAAGRFVELSARRSL